VRRERIKKTLLGLALCASLLALSVLVEAQQGKKIPRLAFLAGTEGPSVGVFQRGLRDLGYVEEKNILIACRFFEETWTVSQSW